MAVITLMEITMLDIEFLRGLGITEEVLRPRSRA